MNISLPNISKGSLYNNIEILIPSVDVKESDLIIKLCEKVEKINILELKFKYLFQVLGKNESDFDSYLEIRFNMNKNVKNIDSKIITFDDLILPALGIKKVLNKTIKGVNLLYRASRDGDSTQFHSKCNGKLNTVTFVKAKNGRKFGGFANQGWHSSNAYILDNKAFLFSLDLFECYYYNSGNNQIYGSSSYGPLWGAGHDLYLASGCLNNNSSTTNQSSSYNYNGKTLTLSGGSNFQAIDYETYEFILD